MTGAGVLRPAKVYVSGEALIDFLPARSDVGPAFAPRCGGSNFNSARRRHGRARMSSSSGRSPPIASASGWRRTSRHRAWLTLSVDPNARPDLIPDPARWHARIDALIRMAGMVAERTNMTLIYVSIDEKSVLDIRDFLARRLDR